MSPDPTTLSAAEQARTVVLQMMAERGRGVVLVGAARLDLALEHLLQAVMAPSADPDDKLFKPDRSLGSLGAKVSLATRLGLIEPGIDKALNAIRSVRNDFAHSAGDPSLAEPRHQKRLQKVYAEAESTPLWLALAPLLQQQPGLSSDEQAFILLVTILVASIEACALLQIPFAPRATVRLKGTSKNCPSRLYKPQASQCLQCFSRCLTHEIRDFSRCPKE